jgi:hypothetical protein
MGGRLYVGTGVSLSATNTTCLDGEACTFFTFSQLVAGGVSGASEKGDIACWLDEPSVVPFHLPRVFT